MNEDDKNWWERAECFAKLNGKLDKHDPIYSPSVQVRNDVKNTMCAVCPVRRNCLEDALETRQIFGVWGGADQNELRTQLRLDKDGKPKRTVVASFKCLYCKSRIIATLEKRRNDAQLECQDCGLTWWTRRSGILPRTKKRDKSEQAADDVE